MRRVARRVVLLALAGLAPVVAAHPPTALVPPAGREAPRAPAGELNRLIARAAPGATVRVPAGVYREHLRVDKPLTLAGEPGAVIDGGGAGDIVEIASPGVTIRGFTIRDTGTDLDKENAAIRVLAADATIEGNALEDVLFGIDVREAPRCVLRGNRVGGKALDVARRGDGIRLWRADDAVVEGNTIHDGRDAILWYSRGVVVRGNTSDRCRYGFHLMYCDEVELSDNTLRGNSVGIYIMYSRGVRVTGNRLERNRGPSGYGLGLKEADRFVVEGNAFIANRVGAYLDGSPFSPQGPGAFTSNVFALNDRGVECLPSVRGATFSRNDFVDNIEQVSVQGRGDLLANDFSPDGVGNYWSDYTGYDADGDGVGDFAHEPATLFESLTDRHPKLRLFLFSPSQQAVEFVARAVPAVRPEPKFFDDGPRVTPVAGPAGGPREAPSRAWLALAGGALLLGGLALLLPARAGGHA